jgi:aminoglycoside phosphotransferase (APT) family kinase protein
MAESGEFPGVGREALESYLRATLGPTAGVRSLRVLGEVSDDDVKRYGYGTAIEVVYTLDGATRRAVFQTVRPGPHGHETMPDRAQLLLSNYQTFSRLPRHAPALDIGTIHADGRLVSLGDSVEFFILTDHMPGRGHQADFFRLRETGDLTDRHVALADALCDYLAAIHSEKHEVPGLYRRRVRELLGHGECIMGLTDAYPDRHGFIDRALLEEIEHQALGWRWRLRDFEQRLTQVHGDFHPWNILFEDDDTFHILDRSRGEWGEPADDVTCLTINYLFFSLQRSGRLEGAFEALFQRFWQRYLKATGDDEMLRVAAPFFAFRGLVLASPVWYPDLSEEVRRSLFAFIRNVLDAEAFNPNQVNACLGAG